MKEVIKQPALSLQAGPPGAADNLIEAKETTTKKKKRKRDTDDIVLDKLAKQRKIDPNHVSLDDDEVPSGKKTVTSARPTGKKVLTTLISVFMTRFLAVMYILNMFMYIYTYLYLYLYIYIHIYLYLYIYIYIYLYLYLFIFYIHIYIFLYFYIFIYIFTCVTKLLINIYIQYSRTLDTLPLPPRTTTLVPCTLYLICFYTIHPRISWFYDSST